MTSGSRRREEEFYVFFLGGGRDGAKARLINGEKGKRFELELIQTQMAQKPMLRAEVGMRVRCANKASAG